MNVNVTKEFKLALLCWKFLMSYQVIHDVYSILTKASYSNMRLMWTFRRICLKETAHQNTKPLIMFHSDPFHLYV